jgi:hypothetical protein
MEFPLFVVHFFRSKPSNTTKLLDIPIYTTIKSEEVYNMHMIAFFSFHTFLVDDGSDTDHEICTEYYLKNEICTMSPYMR